jgi:hypothetical protein
MSKAGTKLNRCRFEFSYVPLNQAHAALLRSELPAWKGPENTCKADFLPHYRRLVEKARFRPAAEPATIANLQAPQPIATDVPALFGWSKGGLMPRKRLAGVQLRRFPWFGRFLAKSAMAET